MDILQIAGIGIIGMILTVTVKKQSPNIAIMLSIAVGIIIFSAVAVRLDAVINMLEEISEKLNMNEKYIYIVLKITGVAYIAQFCSQICTDAGEGAIADKIELGGKVIIMVISAPIFPAIIKMIYSILP